MVEESRSSLKPVLFIFAVLLLDVIGLGIIIPVMPALIMELTGLGESGAASYGGWLLFLFALMQFLFAPAIGNLSDRFGRRPVLLLSLFAFGFDYLIMGFAPNILLLFVGRALAGIAGATYPTAMAYVADVTTPEKRAQAYGIMGSAWGFGFILGPVIGGFLGVYGPRVPFFASAAIVWAAMIFGVLFFPESLTEENRRAFHLKNANPVAALTRIGKYPSVYGLLAVLLLFQIAHESLPSLWTYYSMEKFHWHEREIGLSLGYFGVASIFVQGFLIRASIPLLGERNTVYAGIFFNTVGFIGIAIASQGWMLYALALPCALGALAHAAINGMMSAQVPSNQQGELQGAVSCVLSIVMIVTPLFMTQLFSYSSRPDGPYYFPGAPFIVAAICCMVSVPIFTAAHRSVPRRASVR
ncbi:MAG: TCR/Tet family MFS transporter [Candidatus Hydrogenedentes bacterium]|nr:TCR/Tet family MFS transporter [Candidatus Hydrogenedentota bacterium]